MNITLRNATSADLPTLNAWEQTPHVRAALGADDGWSWSAADIAAKNWRQTLVAMHDDQPFAFVQIIDPLLEDTGYWGDVAENQRAIDIWIGEARLLGRGLGSQIMAMVLERCFADPSVTGILIDPLATNHRAHRFYERLGFGFVEYRVFDRERCSVFRLSREAWREGLGRNPGRI